ncbi:MAG TPA: hypothetical protein VFN75_09310 [Pseudonocardiaceae bacterium]|nr:hypothetical protein [Pseudonocardiaceae bacterium]
MGERKGRDGLAGDRRRDDREYERRGMLCVITSARNVTPSRIGTATLVVFVTAHGPASEAGAERPHIRHSQRS